MNSPDVTLLVLNFSETKQQSEFSAGGFESASFYCINANGESLEKVLPPPKGNNNFMCFDLYHCKMDRDVIGAENGLASQAFARITTSPDSDACSRSLEDPETQCPMSPSPQT